LDTLSVGARSTFNRGLNAFHKLDKKSPLQALSNFMVLLVKKTFASLTYCSDAFVFYSYSKKA